MLLSLVVIFTQSIQLSKIVEQLASLRCYRALGRLEQSSSRFRSRDCLTRHAEAQPEAGLLLIPIEKKNGGADRDRTDDILLAKQALSQLSYSPIALKYSKLFSDLKVVGLGRFELPTSPLSGVRSNQLSYRPRTHSPKLLALSL